MCMQVHGFIESVYDASPLSERWKLTSVDPEEWRPLVSALVKLKSTLYTSLSLFVVETWGDGLHGGSLLHQSCMHDCLLKPDWRNKITQDNDYRDELQRCYWLALWVYCRSIKDWINEYNNV